MSADPPCVFCTLPEERIVLCSAASLAIRDAFPVSPGHTLVIPRRHVASFFDLEHNIGINDGAAAGQTVGHLHIHLIPRFAGDTLDPRGGVRLVLPDKARYWAQ